MACGRQHYKACGRRHKGQAILPRGLNSLHAAYTNDLDGLEQAEVTDKNHEPFAISLLDEKPQMLQDSPQMLQVGRLQGSWRCRRSGVAPDRDPSRQRMPASPAVTGNACGGRKPYQ